MSQTLRAASPQPRPFALLATVGRGGVMLIPSLFSPLPPSARSTEVSKGRSGWRGTSIPRSWCLQSASVGGTQDASDGAVSAAIPIRGGAPPSSTPALPSTCWPSSRPSTGSVNTISRSTSSCMRCRDARSTADAPGGARDAATARSARWVRREISRTSKPTGRLRRWSRPRHGPSPRSRSQRTVIAPPAEVGPPRSNVDHAGSSRVRAAPGSRLGRVVSLPGHSMPAARCSERTYSTIASTCSSVMPSISGMFPKSQWWERTPIIAAAWNAASGWCPGS